MRLVLVVPHFPRLSETFIANKFAGLAGRGWDVHIACGQASLQTWADFPSLATRPDLQGRVHQDWPHEPRWLAAVLWLPVLLLTLLRAPRATTNYWRTMWPQSRWATIKQFYLDATVIALQPDILHFEFGALAVGKEYLKAALDCRLSASFRGYDLNYVGLDSPGYYDRLWATADALHLLGRDLWRRAQRRGCPPTIPHALIPPAIDVNYFTPSAGGGAPDRPVRILSVGRLEWKKGYEYALQAARILDERGIPFEYQVIGDGRYREPLAFTRHELGLADRVTFLGARPHEDVVAAMNWADIFLHASVSEGFCNAVLEAQAMRLPVVASDADGLPENVADGHTGYIVPRRDPAALAEKLAALAADGDLRREMGAAGRARVENCFSLSQQIADFDRFYRDMVDRHAR